MEKSYKYHCNNCYSGCGKNNQDGCFTSNVKQFILDKESSCLDGTFDGDSVKPLFLKVGSND